MSSVSLGRMVTLPVLVTRIVQIAVATVDAGNKKFTRLLPQRRHDDVTMLQLLAQLEYHDTLITARDNANIARLKAEAARLAAQAEASAS